MTKFGGGGGGVVFGGGGGAHLRLRSMCCSEWIGEREICGSGAGGQVVFLGVGGVWVSCVEFTGKRKKQYKIKNTFGVR